MRNTLYVIVLLITVLLLSCVTSQPVIQKVTPTDESIRGNTPILFDDPPRKINEAVLHYPKFAIDAGIQGTVVLEVEVLTNGNVGTVEVLKSILPGKGGLDEAAIEYARRLQFEPAKANGKPAISWITFPVDFFLD